MKTTFKQLLKGLWSNMKIAAKDRVDLIMFAALRYSQLLIFLHTSLVQWVLKQLLYSGC